MEFVYETYNEKHCVSRNPCLVRGHQNAILASKLDESPPWNPSQEATWAGVPGGGRRRGRVSHRPGEWGKGAHPAAGEGRGPPPGGGGGALGGRRGGAVRQRGAVHGAGPRGARPCHLTGQSLVQERTQTNGGWPFFWRAVSFISFLCSAEMNSAPHTAPQPADQTQAITLGRAHPQAARANMNTFPGVVTQTLLRYCHDTLWGGGTEGSARGPVRGVRGGGGGGGPGQGRDGWEEGRGGSCGAVLGST